MDYRHKHEAETLELRKHREILHDIGIVGPFYMSLKKYKKFKQEYTFGTS